MDFEYTQIWVPILQLQLSISWDKWLSPPGSKSTYFILLNQCLTHSRCSELRPLPTKPRVTVPLHPSLGHWQLYKSDLHWFPGQRSHTIPIHQPFITFWLVIIQLGPRSWRRSLFSLWWIEVHIWATSHSLYAGQESLLTTEGNRKERLTQEPTARAPEEAAEPPSKARGLSCPSVCSRWLIGSVTGRRLVPGSGKSKAWANLSDYPSGMGALLAQAMCPFCSGLHAVCGWRTGRACPSKLNLHLALV